MKITTFMPVVTNLRKVKMENCTAWKSGTARKSSLNLVTDQVKAKGKGKTDRECFRCGRIGHIRAGCRAKTHINGGLPKSAPKGKRVGNCEDEESETPQNVPLGTIELGSSEVLSDHGDEVEVDETTEMMPPLPPDSWFKRTETFAGSFGDLAMKITKTKRIHSLIVGMLGTKRTEVCARCERLPLSELPCLFSVPELGVYQRLPVKSATV